MIQPTPSTDVVSPEWAAFRAQIVEATARPARKPKAPKSITANDLTRQIVKFLRNQGAFATRLSSTGTFRADLNKFVPSQQVAGLPDVMAVYLGQAVFVEVKIGADPVSEAQRNTISDLIRADADVFIAHNFEELRDWFLARFRPPFA